MKVHTRVITTIFQNVPFEEGSGLTVGQSVDMLLCEITKDGKVVEGVELAFEQDEINAMNQIYHSSTPSDFERYAESRADRCVQVDDYAYRPRSKKKATD